MVILLLHVYGWLVRSETIETRTEKEECDGVTSVTGEISEQIENDVFVSRVNGTKNSDEIQKYEATVRDFPSVLQGNPCKTRGIHGPSAHVCCSKHFFLTERNFNKHSINNEIEFQTQF